MSSISDREQFDQQRKEWIEIANYYWSNLRYDNNPDISIKNEFNRMKQDYENKWNVSF